MAFFSRTKTTKEAKAKVQKVAGSTSVSKAKATDRNLASVLIRPRVTEKAVAGSDRNVYTFEVRRDATKYDVRDAVIELFKVTPVAVNIVNKSPRQFMSRNKGRVISQKGLKKAYVYLKKGDSISLV
ncbi:uL23 family ribosomal protein [Carnobacterium alterfunditum]|uniref:uL23 family ribosomal protein n=1 Tax=Carnobacterium alterfunditum TaxID=28230 RepID=UPI0035944184